SGGEEGARFGPSIMPGGNHEAWNHIKPIFQNIAAKTNDQTPCCDWVGASGSGHFVKMVHNGIEYGDMQLIAEIYDIMKRGFSLSNGDMHQIFEEWNQGVLESYLIEITAEILKKEENGTFVIDTILDKAGQKGTGKWTVINGADAGIPLTLISEAVFARSLSSMIDERAKMA
ncbi:MAG: NADP-dependent phosphogluconate dehydrogenase, partial [Proteobacteria bacterium]|nr:NADP-dependent phosphogluconate dehydrogenase [Pseudomonadota bacterium]